MTQQVGKASGATLSVSHPGGTARKERADRERRLEALAVAVLTALAECDAFRPGSLSGALGKRCGR